MFPALVTKLLKRDDLTADEAAAAMDVVMRGDAHPAQVAAMLIGLAMKGERPAELVGLARAMRAHGVHIDAGPVAVDTCGTGGDRAGTFNISTAAARVVAATGVQVVKHGNRSVSSHCGSADVLEALGVAVDAPPATVQRAVHEAGIGFCFAPTFHPAMRHAGDVRRALGVPSAFNLLGPLTNPARVPFQIVGVARPELTELMARTLQQLGASRAWVVHGADGLDELSTTGYSKVSECHGDVVRTFYVPPFGRRPAEGRGRRPARRERGSQRRHRARRARGRAGTGARCRAAQRRRGAARLRPGGLAARGHRQRRGGHRQRRRRPHARRARRRHEAGGMSATPDLLAAIVAATRRDIVVRQQAESCDRIGARVAAGRSPDGAAFTRQLGRAGSVNVIAECKRRSPSRGVLKADYDPVAQARAYAEGGAAAISVLTEPSFFDGALAHLTAVRAAVPVPLLRKDFVVDEYQLLEAVVAGADAVLLIASALPPDVLARLHAAATALGLAVLVEVHDEAELDLALAAGASIVGVNNRNLRTLAVDTEVSERLAARMPAEVIAVSESGLKGPDDVARMQALGYRAFLIGERLMTSGDPARDLRRLTGVETTA